MTVALAPAASEEARAAEFLAGLGFGFDPATGQMTMPEAALENIRAVVGSNTVEGYKLYYFLIMNKPCPKHVVGWIEKIIEGAANDDPVLLEAFTGSTKTTAVTQIWTSWQIGKKPEGSGLIIQASDATATNNAKAIADIIEHNPGWKVCFPNVVPDKDAGWGDKGYYVKRTDIAYGEFIRARIEKKDPSFVGHGYTSAEIVGMHPSLFLLIDDIHDEENTRSSREIQHVIDTWSGVIWSRRNPHRPPTVVAFTPWNESDAYAAAKKTGAYKHLRTPARQPDGSSTWPEMFSDEDLKKAEAADLTGGVQFARTMMLDLEKAKKRVFVYHIYPSHLFKTWTWPVMGGVDYAGVMDPTKRNPSQSYFALAYLFKLPEGGAAVFDGVLEQLTLGEAEEYVIKAQGLFPGWLNCVVEMDGKGDTFAQSMIRHPSLKYFPITKSTGGKSKAERIVNGLGPWLRGGRIRVADGDSFFLNSLRSFLNKYPAVGEHDPGWDAADAVYWAARGVPDVLAMPNPEKEQAASHVFGQRKSRSNPLTGIGTFQEAR